MSRHGYIDMDDWSRETVLALGRHRGRVASAMRGKRGQAFLRRLIAALDAMPESGRKLSSSSFLDESGCACALGAVLLAEGKDVPDVTLPDEVYYDDPEAEEIYEAATDQASADLDIAEVLAREVMYENDEYFGYSHKDSRAIQNHLRWRYIRRWAESKLRDAA